MNEDIILSEYLDGELPADLAAMVGERLTRDAAFRARYEAMAELRSKLHRGAGIGQEELANMQARVWQRLQRNLSPRPSRVPAWVAAIGDLVSARVSLPVPALAALLLVFVSLGAFVVLRPAAGPSVQSVATSSGGGQAAMSIPSLGQSGIAVDQMGAVPASLSNPSDGPASGGSAGTGMAVTIEVQNLRQLLSVLENSQGVTEFTIQMPQVKKLEPVGDPALFSDAELETGSK